MRRGRKRNDISPPPRRPSFVTATAGGFMVSKPSNQAPPSTLESKGSKKNKSQGSSQSNHSQTTLIQTQGSNSSSMPLPSIDLVILETGNLTKFLERLYYLLLSSSSYLKPNQHSSVQLTKSYNPVFIIIIPTQVQNGGQEIIEQFQYNNQVMKALNINSFFLHKKTQSNTISLHLKSLFSDNTISGSTSMKCSILFVTLDIFEKHVIKSKCSKRPLYVIPLISSDITTSRNKNSTIVDYDIEWRQACNQAVKGWQSIKPSKIYCCSGPKKQILLKTSKHVEKAIEMSHDQSSSIHPFLEYIKIIPAAATIVRQRVKAGEMSVKANTAINYNANAATQRQQQLHLLLSTPNTYFQEEENYLINNSMKSSEEEDVSMKSEMKGVVKMTNPKVLQSEIKLKMNLLGMFGSSSSIKDKETSNKKESNDTRTAAETCWLDRHTCDKYGQIWSGDVRFGASSDYISRHVRELHMKTIINVNQHLNNSPSPPLDGGDGGDGVQNNSRVPNKKQKRNNNNDDDKFLSLKFMQSHFRNTHRKEQRTLITDLLNQNKEDEERNKQRELLLSKFKTFGPTFGWRPNPEPSTSSSSSSSTSLTNIQGRDDWGGSYGKPCGHNEIVMFILRPFIPMEVLNTKLCSYQQPAPGNVGYHGCLEFLKLQCFRRNKAITIWDLTTFHYINNKGEHIEIPKQMILSTWSLKKLKLFIKPLRYFTIDFIGQLPFYDYIYMINSWMLIGASKCRLQLIKSKSIKNNKVIVLSKQVTSIIISFLIGGDLNIWRDLLLAEKEWGKGFYVFSV